MTSTRKASCSNTSNKELIHSASRTGEPQWFRHRMPPEKLMGSEVELGDDSIVGHYPNSKDLYNDESMAAEYTVKRWAWSEKVDDVRRKNILPYKILPLFFTS